MDAYSKENVDNVVGGSVALARKHLGENASDTAVSHLAGVLLKQALEQEFELGLYESVCKHVPPT